MLLLEQADHLGGASVSAQVFPGVDARLSRYSYLVSLLPQQVRDELGLDLRLVRRSVSSYTPDPRVDGRAGLLVTDDEAATTASFARIGAGADRAGWDGLYARTARAARALWPTVTEPLLSREQARARVGDDEVWDLLVERPVGLGVADAVADDLVRGVALTDALIGTFADPSTDLLANRCFLYHVIGGGTGDWDVPVGGMGAVSGALAGCGPGRGGRSSPAPASCPWTPRAAWSSTSAAPSTPSPPTGWSGPGPPPRSTGPWPRPAPATTAARATR